MAADPTIKQELKVQTTESTTRPWRKMSPEAVCAGSPAQILFCVTDAQKDIVTALDEIEKLKRGLSEVRKFLENPDWGTIRYMDGSGVYDDKDSALFDIRYALGEIS